MRVFLDDNRNVIVQLDAEEALELYTAVPRPMDGCPVHAVKSPGSNRLKIVDQEEEELDIVGVLSNGLAFSLKELMRK